jgi:hypothetical protein
MSDQHRHCLERDGYNALLAEHCELVDRVAVLMERVGNLEAELRRLGCQATLTQEIVIDMGHGWPIVRELDAGEIVGGADADMLGLARERDAAGTAPNAGC